MNVPVKHNCLLRTCWGMRLLASTFNSNVADWKAWMLQCGFEENRAKEKLQMKIETTDIQARGCMVMFLTFDIAT